VAITFEEHEEYAKTEDTHRVEENIMAFLNMPINVIVQLNIANQIAILSDGINQSVGQSNWAFLKH
jgi:hypothetical protein